MQEGPPVFYFGAMSPYSWLAAERIGRLLPEARWRGVLAGVIFNAHRRTSWGLTAERERGLRTASSAPLGHGLGPIRWPEPWPTSDLRAARAMVHAEQHGVMQRVRARRDAHGVPRGSRPRADRRRARGRRARRARRPPSSQAALADPLVKQAVRATNEDALAAGVFGVPSVIVGGELFWGDDRLEDAAAAYRTHERA